jgi:hypothetical protein
MSEVTEIQVYLALNELNFEGYDVPEHTQGALLRYVYNRCLPGSFSEAMLADSLEVAKFRADSINVEYLTEIDRWIKDKLPEEMRGSFDKVRKWCYNR